MEHLTLHRQNTSEVTMSCPARGCGGEIMLNGKGRICGRCFSRIIRIYRPKGRSKGTLKKITLLVNNNGNGYH